MSTGCAVRPLDAQRHVDQLAQLGVLERRAQPLVGQRVDADVPWPKRSSNTTRCALVGRQVAEAQREVARLAFRHRDEVGRDRARHDALAEAQADVDDQSRSGRDCGGVHRLHHAGHARLHHPLDDDAAVRASVAPAGHAAFASARSVQRPLHASFR